MMLVAIPCQAANLKACEEGLTEQGRCESPTQVVWCEDYQQKTLDCSSGEVCAWNDYIKSFDCVQVSCDDVPSTGHCSKPNLVQWCDGGKVHKLECLEGTSCGWNDEIGAFDCMKKGPVDVPTEDTSSPPNFEEDQDNDSGSMNLAESSPVPPPNTVENQRTTSTPAASESGGCQILGARSQHADYTIGLLLLALVFLSRRRAA